jgi:predicted phosphate transport protein (TIGR00153 family)
LEPPAFAGIVRALSPHRETQLSILTKLLPKTDAFFDAFEKQAALTVEGARLFKELCEDFQEVQRKVDAIKDVEHRADDVAHAAFEQLYTQFVTPFDRAMVHRLLSTLDDVLDLTDAAAERLGLYGIQSILPEARELAAILLAQTRKMQEAVHGLRNSRDSKKVLDACMEINSLENQADAILRRALADLFRSGSDPLTVIKWKEILDLVETATDRSEDVANAIENVVLSRT